MIAQLMDAETKASHVVAQARKLRTERLKAAKKEGQKVIEKYIQQKEQELDQLRQQGMQEYKDDDLSSQVEADLKTNAATFNANSRKAVGLLVDAVYNCSIQM